MGLKNFAAEQPHQHALYFTSFLLEELAWHKDELVEALEGTVHITHVNKLLQSLKILKTRRENSLLIFCDIGCNLKAKIKQRGIKCFNHHQLDRPNATTSGFQNKKKS